ncbi:MAG: tyrosine-type recombinase/integrase [Nitrososphaerales archaeon]
MIKESKSESNDLYNRKRLVQRSLQRLDEELDKADRDDILTLVQFQRDKQNELLWINRCITALIVLRKKLKKAFREARSEDIRELFEGMDRDGYTTRSGKNKEYAGSTDEKFRKIIKLFYKVVYGENKREPEAVAWLSTKVRKGKQSKKIDANMFLTEEEILEAIIEAPSLQKQAMIACWYECGARPEEFLNLTNQDMMYDTRGIRVILRGKTGERAIRIAVYGSLLQHWLDVHPRKSESHFPLWISEATNFKNRKMGLRGAEKIIAQIVTKVAPNKNPVPYILRHSRATFLAKMGWNEVKLRQFFGWSDDSNKPKIYIHLSGRDLDNDILALNGDMIINQEEHKIKTSKCIKCGIELYPTANMCSNCGLPTALEDVYLEEIKSESKAKDCSDREKMFESRMNEQNDEIFNLKHAVSMLQDMVNEAYRKINPDLASKKIDVIRYIHPFPMKT